MSDGRVNIDTRLDTGNIRKDVAIVNNELNRIGNNTPAIAGAMTNAVSAKFDSMGRHIRYVYKGTSAEARAMYTEMASAYMQQSIAMRTFKDDLLKAKYGYFQLTKASKDYSGTNQQFMAEVSALGKQYKQTTDQMIAANEMAKMSLIKTAGQMMNLSTQASKISANYDRMANPLYKVNAAGLMAADGLNKLANAGNASVLALKMLGPTANMKQLKDMTTMITQGMMRFQMVAMAAAVSAAFVYSSLHKGALEAVSGYEEAFNRMTSTVGKALQPMIDVFGMIMVPIYNFITAIAEMTIKFNEAHPVLAKIIQGFLMLIPALTLILSPLAVGIGLWAGLQAAWASLWPLIGPMITGFMSMMGTVWLVSAAIVGLVAGIKYLWNTNEGFKSAVITAWNAIKQTAIAVFGFLTPMITSVANAFKSLGSAIVSAIQGDFSKLGAIFSQIIPSLIGFLVGGIPGLIIAASRFIPAIIQGITSNVAQLTTTITTITTTIVTFLTTQVPIFIAQGARILTSIIQGIVQALPILATTLINIFNGILPIIMQMLPVLMQAGIQIITSIIQGITTILPVLIQTIISLVTMIVTVFTTNAPQLLNAGIQVILQLVNGILSALPQLLTLALSLITQVIDAIVSNLPAVLDAGVKILTSLIDGIVSILPSLITTAINLIDQIVSTLASNLPKIIDSGIKVLMSLIDGILKTLPKLITLAIKLITDTANTLIANLPKIIESGVKLLNSLVNGIVKTLPKLIDTAIKLITDTATTLINNLPKIIKAGVELLISLIKGIVQNLPQLIATALKLIVTVVTTLISNLPQIIAAGVKLLLALIQGIISIVGQLIGAITGQIIPAIVNTLKSVNLVEIGKNIIQGLIRGIKSMAGAVGQAISDIASNIKGKIQSALGIHSPSRWMRDNIGKFIPAGIAVGIDKNQKSLDIAVSGMTKRLMSSVSPMALGHGSSVMNTTNHVDKGIRQEINIYSPDPLTPSEVARQSKRAAQQAALAW